MKNCYSVYGLNVISPILLPGTDSDTFHDIELSFSDRPLNLASVTASNKFWQTDGKKLLSTMPLMGQTLIESPDKITLFAKPDLCREHLLTFTLGSGLASSLYLHQQIPLHGAAISTGKGALLFLGASGSGKSTLAIIAASLGYKIFSDDVISLHQADSQSPLTVYPSHNRLKSKDDTAIKLGFLPDLRFTTAPGITKHPCYIPLDCLAQHAEPVAAIYLLQPQQNNCSHSMNPLISGYGVQALSMHSYRRGLATLLQKRQQFFKQSIKLAQQALFYQLKLPDIEQCGGLANYREWCSNFLASQIPLNKL